MSSFLAALLKFGRKLLEPSIEVLEICGIKLFRNTSQMNLRLFFVYSIDSTQVRFPPTELRGQLSQTLRLISPTFPGRQNRSTLVNHYHTQLIILRALYENFHDASLLLLLLLLLLLPLFSHATGLTSSHPSSPPAGLHW